MHRGKSLKLGKLKNNHATNFTTFGSLNQDFQNLISEIKPPAMSSHLNLFQISFDFKTEHQLHSSLQNQH